MQKGLTFLISHRTCAYNKKGEIGLLGDGFEPPTRGFSVLRATTAPSERTFETMEDAPFFVRDVDVS